MSTQPSNPTAQRRALVVDTHSTTRRLCRQALEDAGFAMTEMDSGVAAITSARLQPPDIVLLGRQLRDASGREVMEWLRSNPVLSSTPIVLLGTPAEDAPTLAAVATVGETVSRAAISQAIRALIG